tara:strand:+ start:901 stop:1542 length:642 start_codon:yes stop_codon:yes gene_type:complete
MNISQKTFIGWSLAILPILASVLWFYVFAGIGGGSDDPSTVLGNVADSVLLSKILISIAALSIALVIVSYVMFSRGLAADSDNPFLGNFTALLLIISGAINLVNANNFSASLSMYDSNAAQALNMFVLGNLEFGANDILFGVALITLGKAVREVKNKLGPAIILNIVSFGALIIGVINIVNVFATNDILGMVSWLGWVLVSVLIGIGVIRSKS